ncbi:hypothetical protein AHAS_Ahas11G0213100 [Arachis hypogaea]
MFRKDLFRDLKTNQAQSKLDEIEAIGFGFLKLVPKWHVKQGIMVMLAKAYNIETSTLKLDNGNIRIGPEHFQCVFRIPSGVDDFLPFDDRNDAHVSIKRRFHRLKTIQLRHFVNQCAMDTEDDRIEFRRHFILLILKMFLCLTVQYVISPWYIDTVLDVLYFQKLKHGELENCQEPVLWLSAWTAEELSTMAETVQPGQKFSERDEQRIRGWGVDTSLDCQQIVESYEGRPHLVLTREDLWTLRPRAWLNNSEMILVPKNLVHFQDGPNPVYVGLGAHFGADTRDYRAGMAWRMERKHAKVKGIQEVEGTAKLSA